MQTSYWLAGERPARPPLTGSTSTDVCVVGGGIAGVLTALLLARAGRQVTLLEARQVAGATTGGSTAKVTLLQGTKLSTLERKRGAGAVRAYVDANREGQAWLRHFCDEHGVPYVTSDAVTAASTMHGVEKVRAEHDAATRAGLDVTWHEGFEHPLPLGGGTRLSGQFGIDPVQLLHAATAEVERHGGVVHEASFVTGFSHEGDAVRVTTQDGEVRAEHLVIATNAPIHDRSAFVARIKPVRSHGAAIRSSWRPDAMYYVVDSEPSSVRPAEDGVVIAAGGGHQTGARDLAAKRDAFLEAAIRLLPDAEVLSTWSAQDQSPTAGLPFTGPLLPTSDRVQVITGFDKWGLATAPASALLLAKRLTGTEADPSWADAFDGWRASELRCVAGHLMRNAHSMGQMVSGHAARLAGAQHAPICTHLGGVLRRNEVEDSWDCPLHGSRFTADGQVLEGPATRPLS